MKPSKALAPLACLGIGIAVGALLVPGPYIYGGDRGAQTRVNRFTGVQEYASSKGWVTQQEFVKESMGAAFGGMFGGMRDAVSPSSGPKEE